MCSSSQEYLSNEKAVGVPIKTNKTRGTAVAFIPLSRVNPFGRNDLHVDAEIKIYCAA